MILDRDEDDLLLGKEKLACASRASTRSSLPRTSSPAPAADPGA